MERPPDPPGSAPSDSSHREKRQEKKKRQDGDMDLLPRPGVDPPVFEVGPGDEGDGTREGENQERSVHDIKRDHRQSTALTESDLYQIPGEQDPTRSSRPEERCCTFYRGDVKVEDRWYPGRREAGTGYSWL